MSWIVPYFFSDSPWRHSEKYVALHDILLTFPDVEAVSGGYHHDIFGFPVKNLNQFNGSPLFLFQFRDGDFIQLKVDALRRKIKAINPDEVVEGVPKRQL